MGLRPSGLPKDGLPSRVAGNGSLSDIGVQSSQAFRAMAVEGEIPGDLADIDLAVTQVSVDCWQLEIATWDW